MSDPIVPGNPVGGEYTDSELPLSAELPKEEFDEVEEVLDAETDPIDRSDHVDIDTVEMDVDDIELGPDSVIRPSREEP